MSDVPESVRAAAEASRVEEQRLRAEAAGDNPTAEGGASAAGAGEGAGGAAGAGAGEGSSGGAAASGGAGGAEQPAAGAGKVVSKEVQEQMRALGGRLGGTLERHRSDLERELEDERAERKKLAQRLEALEARGGAGASPAADGGAAGVRLTAQQEEHLKQYAKDFGEAAAQNMRSMMLSVVPVGSTAGAAAASAEPAADPEMQQRMERHERELAELRFWGAVEQQVPGGKALVDGYEANGLGVWLGEPVFGARDGMPASSQRRSDLLIAAIEGGRVADTARMLLEFKAGKKSPAGAGSGDGSAGAREPVVDVAGPKGGASRTTSPGAKRMIPYSEYKRFHEDPNARAGMKAEEITKYEAAFAAAIQEGRIDFSR